MGVLSINNEIRTRFNTQWGTTTPVAWPNVKFVPVSGQSWVRFHVVIGKRYIIDIGSSVKNYRTPGMIRIQLFTPKGKGDAEALAYADTIASIFNVWCGATIHCFESTIKVIGEGDDDWYLVNIDTTFRQEEAI